MRKAQSSLSSGRAEKKIMHVVSKTWEEAGDCTIRVSAKDLKTMTMGTWTKSAPAPRGWDKEEDTAFDVNDLPEGFYWMIVDYLDKSGKRYVPALYLDKLRFAATAEGDANGGRK